MQLTKQQIIQETIDFYTEDPSQVAKVTGGSCLYETKDGRHCAVGRCMTKVPGKLINQVCAVDAIGMLEIKLEDQLKEQYRGHSITFWTKLQELHDYHSWPNPVSQSAIDRIIDDEMP